MQQDQIAIPSRARTGIGLCLALLVACAAHPGSTAQQQSGDPSGELAAANNPCNALEPTIQAGSTTGMMLVTSGTFWRGCNSKLDTQCAADESPGQCVTLEAFQIDQTEVTQVNYSLCVAAGACAAPSCNDTPKTSPSMPVACVTWTQANAYCQWVTSGAGRLPTEAEWEMAARGTDGRLYPWGQGSPTCDLVNFSGCGDDARNAGTTFGDSSSYSVNDMGGNLSEWVNDWYDPHYYTNAPTMDPQGPTSGTQRVRRGGSFDSPATAVRASARFESDPGTALPTVGFRCAMLGS